LVKGKVAFIGIDFAFFLDLFNRIYQVKLETVK